MRGERARSEAIALLGVSAPLMAAYLAEFAMFATTKIVVGRLGYLELAAVGLAGDLTFELLVVLMGLLSAVGVIIAQALGGDDPQRAGHGLRQGLLLATVIGLPAAVAVWHMDRMMGMAGQDPRVVALSQPYLHALAASVLPVLWFAVLRSYVAALGRTAVVMWITVAAVGLNYLLALGLAHGRFGLPDLGVAGAGWATSLVAWLMFLALAAHVSRAGHRQGLSALTSALRIDRSLLAELLRLGLPAAGLVLLESGLFAAVGILSGVLGAKSLAAYQVIMGWVGIPFVIALGLAEGTMVRVALGMGRGSVAGARRAGMLGMALGIVVLAALVVVPVGFPQAIVAVFLRADDPAFADVALLAAELLIIVALFQIFDGLQAIASRALRALRDVYVPLLIAGLGYWVIGIGGGCLLAFALGLAAAGLWWGLALGLVVTGTALAVRFLKLTR